MALTAQVSATSASRPAHVGFFAREAPKSGLAVAVQENQARARRRFSSPRAGRNACGSFTEPPSRARGRPLRRSSCSHVARQYRPRASSASEASEASASSSPPKLSPSTAGSSASREPPSPPQEHGGAAALGVGNRERRQRRDSVRAGHAPRTRGRLPGVQGRVHQRLRRGVELHDAEFVFAHGDTQRVPLVPGRAESSAERAQAADRAVQVELRDHLQGHLHVRADACVRAGGLLRPRHSPGAQLRVRRGRARTAYGEHREDFAPASR